MPPAAPTSNGLSSMAGLYAASSAAVRPSDRARRVAARSSGSSRRRRTPGSAVKRLTTSTPRPRSAFRSARPSEAVADEQRQHVVAEDALVLALVDLDQVVEAEERGAGTADPTSGCRTGRGGRGGRGAVELGAGGDHDRRPAVVDLDALEPAGRDEGVDVRPDRARAAVEAAVLGDPGLGQGAAPVDGAERVAAPELLLGSGSARRGSACGMTRSGRS